MSSLIGYINHKLERIMVYKDRVSFTEVLEYIRDEVTALIQHSDEILLEKDKLNGEAKQLRAQVQELTALLARTPHVDRLEAENEMLRTQLRAHKENLTLMGVYLPPESKNREV